RPTPRSDRKPSQPSRSWSVRWVRASRRWASCCRTWWSRTSTFPATRKCPKPAQQAQMAKMQAETQLQQAKAQRESAEAQAVLPKAQAQIERDRAIAGHHQVDDALAVSDHAATQTLAHDARAAMYDASIAPPNWPMVRPTPVKPGAFNPSQ